jgi:hypothetical protein
MTESVAFGDTVATIQEALLVLGTLYLLLRPRVEMGRLRIAAVNSLLIALFLIPPTALTLISSVGTHLLVAPAD